MQPYETDVRLMVLLRWLYCIEAVLIILTLMSTL